jgi:hypothetical protein
MIRTRFLPTASVVGASAVLLAQTLVSGTDRGWDLRESGSQLFQRPGGPGSRKAAHGDPLPTALKWAGARPSRVAAAPASASIRREGAVLSLLSIRAESSVLTACDTGPDNNQQVASVTNVGFSGSACSSKAVLSNGGECSVATSTQSNPASCSTTTSYVFCSTGPNGTAGAPPGPSLCSVADGGGSRISCSATLVNANDTCSTQGNANGPQQSTCSIVPTAENATCSVGAQATPKPGGNSGGKCSAFTAQLNANQQQTNFCSASSDGSAANGDGNFCSTDIESTNPSCSVFTGGFTPPPPISTDSCSVSASSFTNAACTTQATSVGKCSAISATGAIIAGSRQCSVFNGGAFVSGPVSGRCGTLH